MQAFSSGAQMFLLANASCSNPKREEEVGKVKESRGGGGGGGGGEEREEKTLARKHSETRNTP